MFPQSDFQQGLRGANLDLSADPEQREIQMTGTLLRLYASPHPTERNALDALANLMAPEALTRYDIRAKVAFHTLQYRITHAIWEDL